ncbi:MAG: NFACT family protein [Clostridiales Family XIII bacterium]|jgi:predicted ribosome quality control (RQC) complex YloA/Tae2 family protein|nr:NFACT family protein [Clostridiales Family XIII bacterium]
MPFDGIVISALASQLSARLLGGKIEKIYQPESDELLFHVTAQKEKHKLFLSSNSANPRVHLVEDYGPYPQNPRGFCMLLRKHIQGGRFSRIEQRGSERVLVFTVDTLNELGFSQNKQLIVEIMGKHSNIILIDANSGKIIDSVKRLPPELNRYRQVLPGCLYVEPPSHGKFSWYDVTPETLRALLSGGGAETGADAWYGGAADGGARIAKAILDGVQGFSPRAAEGFAAEVLSAVPANAADGDGILAAACGCFAAFVDKIRAGAFAPRVYLDPEHTPLDFHAFPLFPFEGACPSVAFGDISAAAAYFYSNRLSSNRIRQKSADLLKAAQNSLDRQLLKKQRLLEDLERAGKADADRISGELLTANLHLLSPGRDSAELVNYYDGSPVSIPLEPRLTPSQNAQRYFKRYRKAKTAVIEKSAQLAETEKEIAYLESVLRFIEDAATVEEADALRLELIEAGYLRRRKQPAGKNIQKAAPHAYEISDGFRVLAGRNNRENDVLTFKQASSADLWFHTKDIPGTHVILFTGGRTPSERCIFEAAAIAAWHSKGRGSENVPVDYVLVKHVKKPSGAKPGMVIFTNNRTLYVTPALPGSVPPSSP